MQSRFTHSRFLSLAALLLAALGSPVLAGGPKGKGTIDLFPGKDLKGWKRVALAPDTKLSERNPWSVDAKNKILLCDGKDIKEMLLFQRPVGDGTFHVEWRFRPIKGKAEGYNSGIYVRSKDDGKEWIQVQTAILLKPPFVGDIFGDVLNNGEIKRVLVEGTGKKHVKPVGEWNTFDIVMKGKTITSKLNGATVCVMADCPMLTGHIGLQAEYFFIEFKNLRFEPATK
jgi:hypothetical protein